MSQAIKSERDGTVAVLVDAAAVVAFSDRRSSPR
jgi:hypothetical protein